MPTRPESLGCPPPQPPNRATPCPAPPATGQAGSRRNRRKLAGPFGPRRSCFLAVITGSLAGLTLVYSVDLPQINDLERYRPSTTTDLYDRKGRIIGSFALERREIVGYDDFAPILRQAVISIEDKSFESHWGINVFRVAGAVWHDIRSHGRAQGASTLTMQLARNLFLSSERTAARKIQEAYLAIQIERAFTKEQIFTLYGNQIYLGSGMYGFEAASEFTSPSTPKTSTSPKPLCSPACPKAPRPFAPAQSLTKPSAAATSSSLRWSPTASSPTQAEAGAQGPARPPHRPAGDVRRALVPGRSPPRARKALRHRAGPRGRPQS
jgi:penicillin-binding protein 1A